MDSVGTRPQEAEWSYSQRLIDGATCCEARDGHRWGVTAQTARGTLGGHPQPGSLLPTSANRKQCFSRTFLLYTLPIPPCGPVHPHLYLHFSPWSQPQTDTSRLGEEACYFGARWLVDFIPWVQKGPPPVFKSQLCHSVSERSPTSDFIPLGLKFLIFKMGISPFHKVNVGVSKITIHVRSPAYHKRSVSNIHCLQLLESLSSRF